jgi:hypothetical protein
MKLDHKKNVLTELLVVALEALIALEAIITVTNAMAVEIAMAALMVDGVDKKAFAYFIQRLPVCYWKPLLFNTSSG